MTQLEAQAWKHKVSTQANSLRLLIAEGYERQAWKALGYKNWTECVRGISEEFQLSENYIWRLQAANEVQRNLLDYSQVNQSPIPETHLRPLTKLEPDEQVRVWEQVVATAPEGKITAAHVQAVVDEIKRPVSYHISDDSYEWYTPKEYIEAARGVMGSINLDPASSKEAQKTVQADYFYTKEDDGLKQDLFGNVWLNPPYNMPLIEQFIDKVVTAYQEQKISSAIILTNNSTDTGWFHKLINYPVCFTRGRIRFYSGDDSLATRQGQAIFYLGDNLNLFSKVFSAFGAIMVRYDNQ